MTVYVAPAATHIFGTFYAKGAVVDVSTWPDRAITEALDNGWITPQSGLATETDPVAEADLVTHKSSSDHDAHNDARYAQFSEAVNVVATSGTAQTVPDVTTATMHDYTLTGNCTFTFPAAARGKSFTMRLAQDATGSRTITLPATVKWAGGTAPTWSTAASKVDVATFVCIDGTNWIGSALLDVR